MIFLKNNWNFSVKKEFFVQVKIKGTLFSFDWNVKYNKKKECYLFAMYALYIFFDSSNKIQIIIVDSKRILLENGRCRA